MKIIMIYGQIQSGLGTKNDTVVPPIGGREPIGPTVMMKPFLKQMGGHVTACLCCGNGTSLANPEEVSHKLCAMINKLQPDVIMYGPAFNSADYAGMYVRVVCDTNATIEAKASTTISAENEDTTAVYKDKVVTVKTPKKSNMGLDNALKNMCTLTKALVDGSDTAEPEHRFCFKQGRIYRI